MPKIVITILTLISICGFANAESSKGAGFFLGGGYSERSYEYKTQGFERETNFMGAHIGDKPFSGISETSKSQGNGFVQLGYKTQNILNTPIFVAFNVGLNIGGGEDIYLKKHFQTGNAAFAASITRDDFKVSVTPILEVAMNLGLRFNNFSVYGILGATGYEEKVRATFSVHSHNHVNETNAYTSLFLGAGMEVLFLKRWAIFFEFTKEKERHVGDYNHFSIPFERVDMKSENFKVGSRFYL